MRQMKAGGPRQGPALVWGSGVHDPQHPPQSTLTYDLHMHRAGRSVPAVTLSVGKEEAGSGMVTLYFP